MDYVINNERNSINILVSENTITLKQLFFLRTILSNVKGYTTLRTYGNRERQDKAKSFRISFISSICNKRIIDPML